MKKVIIALFLLTGAFSLHAQKGLQKVDSLLNVLNTQHVTSEEQVNLYRGICFEYANSNPAKLKEYAEKGLALSKKRKDNVKSSLFLEYIGISYIFQTKYDTAYNYLERALDLAIEAKDKNRELDVYLSITGMYHQQGLYTQVLEGLLKALSLSENSNRPERRVLILTNIASVHRRLDDIKQAIAYAQQAAEIVEKYDISGMKMDVYYRLGANYFTQKEYDKALENLLKALDICEETDNKRYEAYIKIQLSDIYANGLREFNKAERYAREALYLAEEFGEPQLLQYARAILATVFIYQKHYKEAEKEAMIAWSIDSTDLDTKRNIALALVIIHAFMGNHDKVIAFSDRYEALTKQYDDNHYHELSTSLEVQYETEKKEMRIAALEERQKFYLWLGIAGGIVILSIFGLLYYLHRSNVQKRKLAEQQVKQLEQEKQLVATQAVLDGETAERSRLARDLHDGLGGMLSVVKLNLKDVKSYSIMENTDVLRFGKALEILDQSIGELRRVAHHMMPDSLMRYGLKVSLEDFCRAIPGTRFQYFGTDERLDSRLEVMLYRCTYELVNNAVKHAQASEINVQLMMENGVISLTVHDNGIGFDPATITYGAGLENIRTRVSAYNGKMHLHAEPGNGTEINIEIELS